MDIIQVPSVEPPKQLTAYVPSKALEDHLLAFLAANNPGGYQPDMLPPAEFSNLARLLIYPLWFKMRTTVQLRKDARRVWKGSNGIIKHQAALNYISRVLGYQRWEHLIVYEDKHGAVVNLNYGKDRDSLVAELNQPK